MQARTIGLRWYSIFSFAVFSLAIGFAVGVLWLVSDRLVVTAQDMNGSAEAILAFQAVMDDLQTFRRQNLLKGAKNNSKLSAYEPRGVKSESQLRRSFQSLHKYILNDKESRFEEVARVKLNGYLEDRHLREERGVSGMQLFMETTPSFNGAIMELLRLIRVNEQESLEALRDAAAVGGSLKRWSLAVLAVFVLTVGFLQTIFHCFIYRPVMALHGEVVEVSRFGRPRNLKIDAKDFAFTQFRLISKALYDVTVELRRQNEQRLLFLSAVAHDLKSPIGAIQMSLGLLADSPPGSNQARELMNILRRQIGHLLRLVDDLMDATRIEAGHLELHMKDERIDEILRDAVGLFSSLSEKHSIELSLTDKPVTLSCDALRLSQVFNNLLSNAIKYSPQGSPVRVKLDTSDTDVTVRIRDQGIGIAPQDIDAIFEPFRRPLAPKHNIPGVGLGLSTSRKIIEAHGGTIQAHGNLGHGTEFVVALPFANARRGRAQRTSGLGSGAGSGLPPDQGPEFGL